MFFWKKAEKVDLTSKEFQNLNQKIEILDSTIKKLRVDMTIIENDYYHQMDKLIKKRLPKDEEKTEKAKEEEIVYGGLIKAKDFNSKSTF